MTLNSPTYTLTSDPDIQPGVEQGPDIDIPPDDEPLDSNDASAVVDDTTPGGD